MDFTAFAQKLLEGIMSVNEETVKFGAALGTFLEVAGPSGLTVATDILTDVATKSITPSQAITQMGDVAAFTKAAQSAVETIKAG
jgi:hypothetical protein